LLQVHSQADFAAKGFGISSRVLINLLITPARGHIYWVQKMLPASSGPSAVVTSMKSFLACLLFQ